MRAAIAFARATASSALYSGAAGAGGSAGAATTRAGDWVRPLLSLLPLPLLLLLLLLSEFGAADRGTADPDGMGTKDSRGIEAGFNGTTREAGSEDRGEEEGEGCC